MIRDLSTPLMAKGKKYLGKYKLVFDSSKDHVRQNDCVKTFGLCQQRGDLRRISKLKR